MTVVAKWKITTRDKAGNVKIYFAGELIGDINSSEEKRLLEQGAVTKVLVEDNKKSKNQKKDGE